MPAVFACCLIQYPSNPLSTCQAWRVGTPWVTRYHLPVESEKESKFGSLIKQSIINLNLIGRQDHFEYLLTAFSSCVHFRISKQKVFVLVSLFDER